MFIWIKIINTNYFTIFIARFIGEEETSDGKKAELTDAPTWIIDPVDGTMNFVHSFPHSAISIALLVDKVSKVLLEKKRVTTNIW